MKPQGIFGIILIIVGVLILIYQGFSYTRKKTLVDVGPLKVEGKQQETVPISPIIGVVLVGAGIFVTVLGAKK